MFKSSPCGLLYLFFVTKVEGEWTRDLQYAVWPRDFSCWSVCPSGRTMGQAIAVTADALSRVSSLGLALWKDERQSKCEATSFEDWTDIRLSCVTRNIDTQTHIHTHTHTHRHTELAKCFWQPLRAIPVVTRLRRCLLNIYSDKWYDSLRRRLCDWSPRVVRTRHSKAGGKHSSPELEPVIPDSKGPSVSL